MLRHAIEDFKGPVAVRYPRGSEGRYSDGGVEYVKQVSEGNDFTLITYGETINIALDVKDELEKTGITLDIIKLGCVFPIDFTLIEQSVRKTKRLLVLEECIERENLNDLLKSKNIAKYKLHTLTGINYDTITRYCKGTIQRIPIEHLVLFCHTLDCQISDIIEYKKK